MNIQTSTPPHLPLLVGGIAAILVSGIAIASLAISAEGFEPVLAPAGPPQAAAAPAIAARGARAYRCGECGVIESARVLDAADEKTGVNAPGRTVPGNRDATEARPVRNSEIVIRLRDGSMRVVRDANPARWRHGERVTIIAGVN